MTKREPRWWFIAYSTALGAVIAGAALAGGNPRLAAIAVPLLAGAGVAMSFTPWGRLRPRSQDEREQAIGKEAALISYYAMTTAVLVGWIVDLAQGGEGQPWSLLAAIGGATFLGALGITAARR